MDRKTRHPYQGIKAMGWPCALTLLFSLLSPSPSPAKLEDALEAAEKRKSNFYEFWADFTEHRNVMGQRKDAEGNVMQDTQKRFDSDGGGWLLFNSDYTNHENWFRALSEDKSHDHGDEEGEETVLLREGQGSHGKHSDSSITERKDDELQKRFNDEANDKKNEQAAQSQTGEKFYSYYRQQTKEVKEGATNPKADKQLASSENGQNDTEGEDKEENETTSRVFMQEEAANEFDQIGRDSSEEVIEQTKNELAYLDISNRALKSLIVELGQNLGQRRIYDASIELPGTRGTVKLNNDTPSCETWQQKAQAELAEDGLEGEALERAQQRIKEGMDSCTQMAQVPFESVNPGYEDVESGQGGGNSNPNVIQQTLKTERDPKQEDKFSRDFRVWLGTLNNAGIEANDVPSDWDYNREEDRTAEVWLNGQTKERMTIAEQMEDRNQQLRTAGEKLDRVKEILPDLKMRDPRQYIIEPGSGVPVYEVTKNNPENLARETGQTVIEAEEPLPNNYADIID